MRVITSNVPLKQQFVNVLAAEHLQKLLNVIHTKLVFYESIVNKSKSVASAVIRNVASVGVGALQEFLKTLTTEYLPSTLSSLEKEFKTLGDAVSLENFATAVNNLSEFLQNLESVYDYQFYTAQASLQAIYQMDKYISFRIEEDEQWLTCVDELLNTSPSFMDKLHVLYGYLVGYSLTTSMCNLIQKVLGFDYSFRRLLTELQLTTNEEHKEFFKEVLDKLTLLCTVQGSFEGKESVRCEQRLEQSRQIMVQIARLYSVLYTWQVRSTPDSQTLYQVPSNATELLYALQLLKIEYLVKHVPGYASTYAESILKMLSTLKEHPKAVGLTLLGILLVSNFLMVKMTGRSFSLQDITKAWDVGVMQVGATGAAISKAFSGWEFWKEQVSKRLFGKKV